MFSHQSTVLLVDVALILLLARVMGAAARRLGQPAVIGEICAGILLGPTIMGGSASGILFPDDVRPILSAIADIGLAMFMFTVGLELNSKAAVSSLRAVLSVSLGSTLVPLGAGIGLAYLLIGNHPSDRPLAFALFMGTAISVTAFPVLARILVDWNLHRTPLGTVALASAAATDLMAWSALAAVVAFAGVGGSHQWLIALVPAYIALMFGVVRPLMRRLATAPRLAGEISLGTSSTVVVGILLSGAATAWLGLHLVFGAFLFGVIMPVADGGQWRQELSEQLGRLCRLLLLPVFFAVAGLRVDLSDVGLPGLGEFVLILVVAVAAKFAGTFGAARLHGIRLRESAALATLMNTRGLTELIVLSIGLELGLIDVELYSYMVLVALGTTAMAAPLLRLIYPLSPTEENLADAGPGPANNDRRGLTDAGLCPPSPTPPYLGTDHTHLRGAMIRASENR